MATPIEVQQQLLKTIKDLDTKIAEIKRFQSQIKAIAYISFTTNDNTYSVNIDFNRQLGLNAKELYATIIATYEQKRADVKKQYLAAVVQNTDL